MSDMFIPRKERLFILFESFIYIILVILGSYFTICGNTFIRMVPMLYFLGLFGLIIFHNPIITIVLTAISVITFGTIVESGMNIQIILFCIYSVIMVSIGELTGYAATILYENFKLRKFLKYYHKIWYIVLLIFSILIPLGLNNIVNSNIISYLIAKNNVNKYICDNYGYADYALKSIRFSPSSKGGIYEFDTIINGVEIDINYDGNGNISDENIKKRTDNLTKISNAEINIILKENSLTNLKVDSRYEYSKVAINPDIIRMRITDLEKSNIDEVIEFFKIIQKWDKFELLDRIDLYIENSSVTINKKDILEGNITKEYILNGMNLEILDDKENK